MPARGLLVGLALLVGPHAARAACKTASELGALSESLRAGFSCARVRLTRGTTIPCTIPAPPVCAGAGVDAALALVTGEGPTANPPGSSARAQVRCQGALITASSRYARRRIGELGRGARSARGAGAFASVQSACHGVVPVVEQGVLVPSLGTPCSAAPTLPGGRIDGLRTARCARAALEGTLGAMTTPLPPNVVVVMTDDQNVASAALMTRVQRFRGLAVEFGNALVSDPVCAPSRATLLTGQYAHRHGVVSNYLAAPSFDASSTLATWLHDAGYVTALIGKYLNYEHLLAGVPPGWDEWQALSLDEGGDGYDDYGLDENGVRVRRGGSPREYSTDLLAARALAFVDDNASRPFFLLFTPYAPHIPAIPARRHAGSFAFLPPWRPANWHEPDVSTKPTWVQFVKAIWKPASTVADDAVRIAQVESLQAVDEAFGRLEDELERAGLLDNTVLVFTSDHGYHWGEHWWNSKFTQYEESLRVPLIVGYPVLAPQGGVRDEMVANIDLAPTLAALAGVTPPPDRDGLDLSPLLTGPGPSRDDLLIGDIGAIIVSPWSGVREGRFKYVAVTAGAIHEELYDLDADPLELDNLAFSPAHAAELQRLRDRLAELQP
ncbi:sulfatase [Candidatus Binatia bacterium]|nr:sulfatase [Candidatus Binatia bacterium]